MHRVFEPPSIVPALVNGILGHLLPSVVGLKRIFALRGHCEDDYRACGDDPRSSQSDASHLRPVSYSLAQVIVAELAIRLGDDAGTHDDKDGLTLFAMFQDLLYGVVTPAVYDALLILPTRHSTIADLLELEFTGQSHMTVVRLPVAFNSTVS
ncbi:hypothetical protein BDZ89DRAFT_1146025 [Hymenopellis radicata]|nr:hypothetical protein BDZ89DRAFT_1146025 [Hymenopellis radicata]